MLFYNNLMTLYMYKKLCNIFAVLSKHSLGIRPLRSIPRLKKGIFSKHVNLFNKICKQNPCYELIR